MGEVQASKQMTIAAHRKGALVAPAGRRCYICGRYLDRPPPPDDALPLAEDSGSVAADSDAMAAGAGAGSSVDPSCTVVVAHQPFRPPSRSGGASIVLQGQRVAHRHCYE